MCNKKGHLAKDYPRKQRRCCTICMITSHHEKNCFFRKTKKCVEEEKVYFLTNGTGTGKTALVLDSC